MCRGPASFEPTEAKLKELGADFRFYATDATDRESVAKSFTQVQAELGTVEVLVYNCGGGGFGIPVLEIDPAAFVRSFEASCLGALLCAQQVRRTRLWLSRLDAAMTAARDLERLGRQGLACTARSLHCW